MSLSPLKFSLGISLVVHGVVIGGAVCLGVYLHTNAIVDIDEVTTLELLAAPASVPEPAAKTVVATSPPAPAPPTPEPAAKKIAPAKIVPAVPSAEPTILPAATSPDAAATETVSIPPPIIPPSAPAANSAAHGGDSSSATPGNDATTVAGKPLALARPDHRKNPEPEYPLAARRRGQQGTVVLNVTVSAAGRATEVSLRQSSGFELLDRAALRAVPTWEFEPARVDGVAVESRIEQSVRFKLAN